MDTRTEISLLEQFHNAARGAALSAGPIIAAVRELSSAGQYRQAFELLETAAQYRDSFPKEDYGLLCIATIRLMIESGDLSGLPLSSTTTLVRDRNVSEELRAQLVLSLAELSATSGQYESAVLLLTQPDASWVDPLYSNDAVRLARAVYQNLAGDAASALEGTKVYRSEDTETNIQQQCSGLIQYAWSLTHSGRFRDSDNVLSMPVLAKHTDTDVLNYIRAWNHVGLNGSDFGAAIRDLPGFRALGRPGRHQTKWINTYFAAWRAFAVGELDESLYLFRSLQADNVIEPTLNGTRAELAMRGIAHVALDSGDYVEAHKLFQSLSTALPARPAATRLQLIMDSFCYGLVAAKLNPIGAADTLTTSRRCAQVTFGRLSPIIPRIMDLEAELLLSVGRSSEARATRIAALDLISNGPDGTNQDRISHELGLCLIDAYENQGDSALSGLQAILPALLAEYGPQHELTFTARYTLASLTQPLESALEQFEALHEDLVHVNGASHLLTLKALYGVAKTLHRQGATKSALEVLEEIFPLVDDLPQNQRFRVRLQRCIGESHRAASHYGAACKAFESALGMLEPATNPADHHRLQIDLDLHECLIKRGTYRTTMQFFKDLASSLRAKDAEKTPEYFRAVEGYASCLEHLGNHKGAAHNYGHLLDLYRQGVNADDSAARLRIFTAAAWNNELSEDFTKATINYEAALQILYGNVGEHEGSRLVKDIEHRLTCCKARVAP